MNRRLMLGHHLLERRPIARDQFSGPKPGGSLVPRPSRPRPV